MISRTKANRIELIEFILFVLAHVIYAALFFKKSAAYNILAYAVIMSILAAVCLYVLKNETWSQLGFIFCVMIATHLIGTEMGTLAYGICIYMVTGALISITESHKINIYYFVIVNLAIAFGLATEYPVITQSVTIQYYVMMILFCEAFLATENLIVMLYQQKVNEVEEQNKLLNIAKQSKDEFLANMSHEIRTPMNAIVGMSELIMRESDNDKVREYCYNIQNSGENLLGIINDILDFSKIESGKMDIVNESYSLASVTQDVVNTAMFRRGYKNLDIIIDCSPNMPTLLLGDELRNRQILMNIVGNAVKFTKQGYVFISLDCYEKNGENWLKIVVEDTGVGIKEEDQAHLFESFTRMDTTKNRSIEGTGLGLVICKRLVESMHGTIEIQSEYGKGTVVEVNLPQQIINPEPFLTLKDSQNMKVIMYGDQEQYHSLGDQHYKEANLHFWGTLGIPFRTVTDFMQLTKAAEKKEMTHLFIGAGEYTDQKKYYESLAKDINVFVMYDPQYPLRLGKNIRGVHLPFYSINIVSALNGEAFYNQLIDEKEIQIEFKAPKVRALVVDDNEINLRVAEGVLKLYDMNCLLAKSGKEAIEILKDQDIDIVFMDHMMPEMDGIETTEIIRRTGGEYGKNLPIIALTANVVNDAKDLFLENGFQDFLPKPIALKTVDGILRKWLPKTKLEYIIQQKTKEIPVFEEMENTEAEPKSESKSDSNPEPKQESIPFQVMQINESTALENMGGQRDLFKELLEYCLELEENRKQEINESFENQDWKEYTIRVHALKGAMRSLGIEELALVAQAQEFACKEDRIEDAIEGHAHLMEEYERGHRSIECFLKQFLV